MADPLQLQITLQRTDASLPTDVTPLRFSLSHRVPTSAYFVKRQAWPPFPGSPVIQHSSGANTLVQLPSAYWCASPRKGRRCFMASAALLINFPDTTNEGLEKTVELPPLAPSTVIPGLPPPQPPASGSQLHEAGQRLRGLAERWGLPRSIFENWSKTFIPFWSKAFNPFCSAFYSGTVNTDRFVAISSFNTIGGMLDDIFFNAPDALALKECGIDSASVCESPETISAFFKHLDKFFRQQASLPRSPTPIEGIMWELGHNMRRLSTPAWFAKFASTSTENVEAPIASHADHVAAEVRWPYESNLDSRLEAYSTMRVRDSGCRLMMMLVEFACLNDFLPEKFKAHPTVQQLADAAALHMVYVNDLFSYSKEVLEEPSDMLNLVKLLMDHQSRCHGDPSSSGGLPQAAWEAVDLIMAQAHKVTELEQQLFDLVDGADQPEAVALRTFIGGVKSGLTGNFYCHATVNRYRHPDSVFPELRGNVTH